MSRWSVDPLRLALAPGEVALGRGNARQALAAATPGHAGLLPLLDEALADARWQSRRVEVVLSQHFVRHVLTPPPGAALAQAEERALVSAALRDVYGDEVARWKVEVYSQPPQHGLVGAAVDADLVAQLEAVLSDHGFRDIRIVPLATRAARRLPRRFAGWWAVVEPGWLSVFAATQGGWCHASALPVDERWPQTLADFLAREASDTTSGVWVQPAGVGPAAAPGEGDARWHFLPQDPAARGALAMLSI